MARKHKKAQTLKHYVWRYWWQKAVVLTIAVFVVIGAAGTAFATAYQNRVFPGVGVGAYLLGGLSMDRAEEAIASRIEVLRDKGLIFTYRNRTVSVPMVATAPNDPDLSYEVVSYDLARTAERAYRYGRTGPFLMQWYNRLSALFKPIYLVPDFSWRIQTVRDILHENLKDIESPAQDSALVITGAAVRVSADSNGTEFQYDRALKEAESELVYMLFTPIPLSLEPDTAVITQAEAEIAIPEAHILLANFVPVTITHEDHTWTWYRTTIASLLMLKKNPQTGLVELALDAKKVEEALVPLRTRIDVPTQDPRFKRENGKVVEFKASKTGRSISLPETIAQWEERYVREHVTGLSLVVHEVAPTQDIADLNDLGITELLGVGKSNFAGSPNNRRHNIQVGADAVNGTLIEPGSEFSLLKTLGAIDATTGYLPELVIKGNKTVPEYGGGLCQIGTTTFRGTLAAGLPVTMRQNHSYSVTYYYDDDGLPGTDATIYDPAPDYRFVNDTGKYVLILTRIEGNDLYFEFWGTHDGRVIEQSKTRVWDKVPPPPTKYIETLDLPVGKKKCTESPHAGIKAAFDYTVAYPGGEEKTNTFTSQYRPWQEVCLIGVLHLTEDTAEDSMVHDEEATSTMPIIEQ